jgi:hypothetical protein
MVMWGTQDTCGLVLGRVDEGGAQRGREGRRMVSDSWNPSIQGYWLLLEEDQFRRCWIV